MLLLVAPVVLPTRLRLAVSPLRLAAARQPRRLTTSARSVLLPSVTTAADRERTPAPRARAQMHPTTRLHRADSFSSSALDISTRMCESPPTTGGRFSASRPVLLESLGPPEAFSFRPAPSAYRTLSSALTRAMMLLDQVGRFSAPSRDRRHAAWRPRGAGSSSGGCEPQNVCWQQHDARSGGTSNAHDRSPQRKKAPRRHHFIDRRRVAQPSFRSSTPVTR